MSDVLVEVFDQPEHLLLSYPENVEKKKVQRRLAACVTGKDGMFCFSKLRAGKYDLLFSKDSGWKHTHVYVIVASRNRKSTRSRLEIWMEVGT